MTSVNTGCHLSTVNTGSHLSPSLTRRVPRSYNLPTITKSMYITMSCNLYFKRRQNCKLSLFGEGMTNSVLKTNLTTIFVSIERLCSIFFYFSTKKSRSWLKLFFLPYSSRIRVSHSHVGS